MSTKIIMLTMWMIMMYTITKLTKNSKKLMTNKNSNNPFECGFLNQSKKNQNIPNNFFSFIIMFLILEMEIILFMPSIFKKMEKYNNMFISLLAFIIASIILIEWNKKSLMWSM